MKQLKKHDKNIFLMIVAILLFSTLSSFALADLTDLTIQGKLTDDVGDVLTGTYSINFTIYDSYSGGNSLWTQTSSVTTDARGIYSVILDNVDLDFNAPYYLGIKVGSDSEMTPRFNLTSSPYANSASGLNDTIVLDNNVSFDSGTLFIDTTNNRVGIGTETPTQVLEVAGNVNISGSNKLYAPEICIAGDCQTSWPSSGGASSAGGWTNTSTMTTTNINASIAGNLTINGTLELNSSGAGTGIYFHSSSAQNSNHEIYSDSSDNWIFSMAGIGSGKSLTIGDSQHGLYTHASYTKIRSSASADLDFEFGGAIKHMMNSDGLSLGSSVDPLATLHIYTIGNLSQGITFGDGDSGIYEKTDDNIYMQFGNTNNTIRFYDSSAGIIDLGHRSAQDAAVRIRADNSDNAYFESQFGYGKAMYIGSTVSTQTRIEMSHAQIIFHTSTDDDFIWIDSNSDPNQFIVDYSKQYTGNSSLPTFGFGDLDTGLYENADDNLTLTVGGTALVNYNTTDLSILGSGKLRAPEICIAGDCQTSWPSSGGASSAGGWTNDSSWTNTSLNVNITGNLSVDTDTLFVDSTNNRVGIGHNAPSALIDVKADDAVSSNYMAARFWGGADGSSKPYIKIAEGQTTGGQAVFDIYNSGDAYLQFRYGNSMTTLGSLTPLTIRYDGTILASGTGANNGFWIDDVNNGMYTPQANVLAFKSNNVDMLVLNGTDSHVNITNANFSVDTNTLFVDSTNNRVGIGTATPSAELEVNGKILAYEGTSNRKAYLGDDGLYISRTSDGTYASTITADGTVTFNTRNNYVFNSNGANTITFFDTGRIRIGSGTPQSILGLNGGVGSLSTGLTFGDGDTGFYESADDVFNLSVGGTDILSVNTSDLEILGSGKLRAPEICLAGSCQSSWPSGADGYIGDVSSHTAGGSLDMNSNVISNIGASGTDFSSTGGLTLADGLVVSSGTVDFPSASIPGDDISANSIDAGEIESDAVGVDEFDDGVSSASIDDVVMVDNGDVTQFIYVDIPDCDSASDTLNYDVTSQSFSCGVDSDVSASCLADEVSVAGTCRVLPNCSDGGLLYDNSSDTFSCDADADTTYSASGTLLDLTSETFSVNEGTLTNSYLCIYVTGTGLVCNTDPSTYLDNTDTNLTEADVEGYVYDNDNTLGSQWTVTSAGTYDINFDTNTLVVDTGANRVGIGTATPLAKLHINGGTGSLATGLVFGNGDTGLYESSDNFLVMNATNVSVSDGTNAIVFTPKSINSTITTTGGSNLTISSSGGNVVIQLG